MINLIVGIASVAVTISKKKTFIHLKLAPGLALPQLTLYLSMVRARRVKTLTLTVREEVKELMLQ